MGYEIAGRSFRSKKQVEGLAKQRLHEGEADDFIRCLIPHHRDYGDKLSEIGGELLAIEVRPTKWGNNCFWMIGPTGEIDISIKLAVRDMGSAVPRDPAKDHRADFLIALRCEIRPQIDAFLTTVDCPSGWHVDHKPPRYFAVIVEKWLNGRDVSDFAVDVVGPGEHYLKDRVSGWQWQEYHRAVADLRVAPPEQLTDVPPEGADFEE
jgi:hypothetical protein